MNISIGSITAKLQPYIAFAKRYAVFIFIVFFLATYLYLVQKVDSFIQNEPTQAEIDSSAKPVSRLKIDQEAVKQITDLEAQNIEIQSLFDEARKNPFTE